MDIIEEELKIFHKIGVKEVAILDPIFFRDKERAKLILDKIKRICPEIRFEIQTKFEHLNDELIGMISELNIYLGCGVQTSDPFVQKEIKRLNNNEKMIKNMKLLEEKGINFEVHLIYGLPYQDIQSLQADFKLLNKYTSEIKLFPLSRLRGTGLDVILGADNSEMVFSPIFPREVISTKWINTEDILEIKINGLNSTIFLSSISN